MSNLKRLVCEVVAVVSFLASAFAVPQYVVPIEVSGYSGAAALEDFPVLVRLPQSFDYAHAAAGGADLSFVLADGTTLAHEVDTWNPDGESLVWVKLPRMANGVKFYCRYGDDAATAPSAAETARTWSGFAGVWHLGDEDGVARDSGRWGLDGQSKKTVGRVAGKLGGAHMVSTNATKGVDGAIVLPDYSALGLSDKFAVSMWVTNCFQNGQAKWHANDVLVSRRSSDTATAGGFYIRVNGSYSKEYVIYGNGASGATLKPPADPNTDWVHLAFSYSTNYVTCYANGVRIGGSKITYNVRDNSQPLVLGNSTLAVEDGTGSVSYKGAFDEFRLRGMDDNADWFTAEYETVAKADFLTFGAAQANGLIIGATGGEYGTPNPAYGVCDTFADGAVATCTADEVVAVDETTRRALKGWRVIRADGTVVSDTGATAVFTYHAGDRLVWDYATQYKVTATAAGNGSVTGADTWADEGSTVTLTAVPGEEAGFWKWTGDVRETYALADAMPLVVDGPKSLTAHFGGVLYVSPNGDNSNGSSWATAYTHPQTAINAANEGDTVILDDGTYEWNDSLAANSSVVSLSKNVVVRSRNGSANCIVDAGRLTNKNRRGLYIAATATEAHVCGISFINGCDSSFNQNTPVESHAGLIDNCYVRGFRNYRTRLVGLLDTAVMRNTVVDGADMTRANTDGQPCGVYLDGKTLLENCEIKNCTNSMSGVWLGGSKGTLPILENNPVVRGCYIHDNDGQTAREGGGVRVNYYGTIENCTIVRNHSGKKGGGVFIYGANTSTDNAMTDLQLCFRNNIIWDNTSVEGDNLYGAGVTDFGLKNAQDSCAPEAIEGERGNTAQDPLFVDAANGDWRLRPGSPCIRADGTWMGAFEPVTEVEAPMVGLSVKRGAKEGQFVFSAVSAGLDDGVTYAWDFGDGTTATGADVTHAYALGTAAAYDVTVTATDAAGVSVSKTVEKAACTVGETVYVDANGGNVPPYDTWAKAATSLEDAVKMKPSEIVVAAGEYELFRELIVESPTAIRGATGNPADVRIWGNGRTDKRFLRLVTLNHAEASISGVTLSGGYFQGNSYFGSAVRIAAPQKDTAYTESPAGAGGTVSNCVITGNYAGGKSAIGVIYANSPKAVVTHVRMSDNSTKRQTDTGTTGGLALHLDGGSLGRDIIIEHTTSEADKPGAIVYVRSSTLLNATVVNNTIGGVSAIGGVQAADAKAVVQNCVIAGNTTTASEPTLATWGGTAACFINCAMDKDAPNESCYAGAELSLADLAGGDYHPITGSKCIDGGADHALLSALDLDGNRRVQGEAVDIGCYEFDSSAFSVGFAPDRTTGFAPATIIFTPTINGCDEGDDVKGYWDFDGDGVADYVTLGTNALSVTLGAAEHSVTLTVSNETKGVSGAISMPNVVKVGPKVMYVKDGNAGAAYPFDGEANAAATMQSAIDEALDGTDIRVLPGVYQLADATAVYVDREITIGGATGNPEDVVLRGTTVGNGGPCLAMNAGAKALVHSMVFENGKNSDNGAVYISSKGGAVSNCVVRNCTSVGKWGWGNVHCTSANGLVTHCVITNNLGRTGQSDGSNVTGIGADFSAGRLEHCLIARNRTVANGNYTGMGQNTVSLSGDAVARFVTVVSNMAWNVAGINLRGNARFEYCVIAGNHSSHTDAEVDGYANEGTWSDNFTEEQKTRWNVWGAITTIGGRSDGSRKLDDDETVASDATTATAAFIAERAKCSVGDAVKINADCEVALADEVFKGWERGDYRIRVRAPIVNAVSPEALAEAGLGMPAVDAFGNPRLVGSSYDLGGIECQRLSGAMLMVK